MKYLVIYCLLSLVFWSCKDQSKANETISSKLKETSIDTLSTFQEKANYKTRLKEDSTFIAKGFDFPVGKPNANGYYNAQKFKENNHLGDDWNGLGGGNSDLGDPIYSIANGYISEAKDYKGGWGNVIRIVHFYNNKFYESLYAHCDSMLVSPNQFIKKGEQIATIGNCNGTYYAHLHLEIRNDVDLDIGDGYSTDTTGYLNPTDFIKKNRN
ncbi:peptidase M23-like protein [Winogradskyella eximia]|uniref:Peptidase M23-like protein n=1 Tax=Winogradskyella eximia TaxID=262006 RepID=A0A3D9GQ95_9FLAO|nr:M23 family metallopeptidase [Winogradskyella eximia]RED38529.1 peptidase M23-like protein [Winogradskyella eximia]